MEPKFDAARGSRTKLLVLDAMNVLKGFIGSNYLMMPFAFSKAGLLLGSIALPLIAFLTDQCCGKLIMCKQRAVSRRCGRTGEAEELLLATLSYGDVAREAFGQPWAEKVVDLALSFTQFGFCVDYNIFIVTTLHDFLPGIPIPVLVAAPLLILMPCVMLPSVSALSPISMLANIAIMGGFIGCMVYESRGIVTVDLKEVPLVKLGTFPMFFSITLSCFEGIGTVLVVESKMASGRENYPFFLHRAVLFTVCFLGVFGAYGFIRFGKDAEQIATENFPIDSKLSEMVHGFLLIAILGTFPLQIWPVVQSAERWCLGKDNPGRSHDRSPLSHQDMMARADKFSEVFQEVAHASNPLHGPSSSMEDAVGDSVVVGDDETLGPTEARRRLMPVGPKFASALAWSGVELLAQPAGPGHASVSFVDVLALYGPIAGRHLGLTAALRAAVVLGTSLVALAAKDYFGYVASLTGALGATTLTFIMPSLMHLWLFEGELSFFRRFVNVATAAVGVIGGSVSLAITLVSWGV
mmetsp:Transcript_49058/g.111277  ORF Transcript_49058/g.111277 Transcript_49058/m.111277 type:complete len:523 (-) Transcript_49058:185-1753(-)